MSTIQKVFVIFEKHNQRLKNVPTYVLPNVSWFCNIRYERSWFYTILLQHKVLIHKDKPSLDDAFQSVWMFRPKMALLPLGTQSSQECQEQEDQGIPLPLLHCHPVHKDLHRSLSIHPLLHPLVYHSSIPPPVRLWRDPVQPTDVSRRQVEYSLLRVPLTTLSMGPVGTWSAVPTQS